MNIFILTIILPFISFIILSFSHKSWSEKIFAIIGIGSIGIISIIVFLIDIKILNSNQHLLNIPIFTWISVDNFNIKFSFILDNLSITMLSLITFISFLISIFSSWYMHGKEGYSRFFAYINLFIAGMITLVSADNMLLMYLGWEIAGMCSYLLIGFYNKNYKNNISAMKAFIMTRISDVFLIFSLFIIYNELGTLSFCEMSKLVSLQLNSYEKNMLWWSTLMLLGGVIGKSAQIPLQTWLIDAMVGPTPASALIHSATMVVSGVYLITRTYFLFLTNIEILQLVGIVGSITLILASLTALVQTNIKRILACSTISQVGYMFLAIGAQAWNEAIFHLIIHAFFKSLLFLASGYLIMFCQNEQNIFKIGCIKKSIPLIYLCFLVGSSSLSALPILTSGFFSKEEILIRTISNGHINLVIVGLFGTLMTSIYTFRMFFVIFHSHKKKYNYDKIKIKKGITYYLPLIILLSLSTFLGKIIILFLKNIIINETELNYNNYILIEIISSIIPIIGIIISAYIWLGKNNLLKKIIKNKLSNSLKILWYNSWGFDWLYNILIVKPFIIIARLIRYDPIDKIVSNSINIINFISKNLLLNINGYLRSYIISIGIGTLVLLIIMLLNLIL